MHEQRILYSKLIIDGDQVKVMLDLEIQQDLLWKVYVKGRTIDANSFTQCRSMLPYHANSLANVQRIFEFINSCSICCGNSDKKFQPLIDQRKGEFMNISGSIPVLIEVLVYIIYL